MNSKLYTVLSRTFASHLSVILLLLAPAFCPTALHAQGVTTGSMSGIVSDTLRKNLTGTTITAVHEPTGTKYGAIARSNGRYNIRGMRVGGPYTVRASFIGFGTQEKRDVYVVLGQDVEVNFTLRIEAKQTGEVVVTAEKSSIMNPNKKGSGSVLSEEQISTAPTINRSIGDIARLNPLTNQTQTAGSDGLQGVSVAGQNSRYNNFQIDGAVANDIFGLGGAGTAGSQANANFISLDAIQELQINISPYDVRQSGFTGGIINAVTRGGTNRFTGSVFSFGRNEALVGLSPDVNRIPYNDFSDFQFGGRIGGPIVENRLFFHLTAERRQRVTPLQVGLNDPNAVVNFPASLTTIESIRDIAREQFGYDAGSAGIFNQRNNSTNIIARFDWNISDEHRIQFRHNFTNAFQDRNVQRDNRDFSLTSQWNEFRSMNNSTVLQLNSLLSNTMSNELRLTYTQTNDSRALQAARFPSVRVWVGAQESVWLGPERNSQANSLDQNQFALTDDFTMFLDDHVVTIGTYNEWNRFNNLFITDNFGYYEFARPEDFRDSTPSYYSYKYANTAATGGNLQPRADWSMLQAGLYVQDDWNVTKDLRISAGIRADVPVFFDEPYYNPLFERKMDSLAALYQAIPDAQKGNFAAIPNDLSTSQLPKTQVLWSPRIGFNWDVNGDRSLQIRGGSGVFTGRTAAVWLSNQYSNTGIDIYQAELGLSGSGRSINYYPGTTDPVRVDLGAAEQPRPGVGGFPASFARAQINVTDRNFRLPQVWRSTLGFDYALVPGLTATLEGIYSKQYAQVDIQNLNLRRSRLRPFSEVDGRPIYAGASNPDSLNVREFTQVYYLRSRDEGYQYSLMAQLSLSSSNSFLPGVFGTVAYTNSAAYDLSDMRNSVANSNWRNTTAADPNNNSLGRSNFDVPHRILVNLGYSFELADKFTTSIGLYYSGNSGRPYSYCYLGDVNGDGVTFNDLVYVPTESDFGTKVIMEKSSNDFRTTEQIERQFMDFINANSSLAPFKGSIVERNSAREPWLNQFDLHLGQIIPLPANQKLEITFDVQNVLNLLNSDWGHQRYLDFSNFSVVEFVGWQKVSDGTGTHDAMRLRFTNPDTVQGFRTDTFYSRWRGQLGLRYSFN